MEEKLTREEVLHVAHLARIGLTEEEIKKFLNSKNPKQVNNISPNMEELKNIKYFAVSD